MTRFSWITLALSLAAVAGADELPRSFQHCLGVGAVNDLEQPSGPRVPRAEITRSRAAMAGARSFRACASFISLAQKIDWGLFEYAAPDRRRWLMRSGGDEPGSPPRSELEAVQVGADAWVRSDGGPWTRVEAGRKLIDAAPKGAWLPDPADILRTFFDKEPKLLRVGTAGASPRTGACEVWAKANRKGLAFYEQLYVGPRDRRPHRVSSGGPGVEAYLQLEIYDYDTPIVIEPPH